MAKKGGQQQLQAEISNDEEFEKFVAERPGLLVLDVYSEWCGPCLGMVGSLRKIKLELGGDNLHLAICKADYITCLKRFARKSEPSWLFVTNGKSVNLMFGTNVPKLMKLIAYELGQLNVKSNRHVYDLCTPLPEEIERTLKKEGAAAEAARIEQAEKAKKRRDYLNFVTDTIIENLPDIGVTMFGPQVNRDMFKKIAEPADALKIQCKDRRVALISIDDFEVINYACKNPLEPDIIEQFDGKELLLCFWKMPEGTHHSIPDILQNYAHELTKSETVKDVDGEEHVTPPILSPLKVKVEVEWKEGEEWSGEEEPEPVEQTQGGRPTKSHEGEEIETEKEEEEGEGGGEEAGVAMPEMPGLGIGMDIMMDMDEEKEEEEEPEAVIEEPPKKRTRTKTITLPPVWVPNNHRTHAALIYVYFRTQTNAFLPPDPKPEPPHVIMAFDAYKKRDLISLAERNEDVMLYGFFTSDDVEEAKYIATSDQIYAQRPHTASDKIVFKVAKQTSHTMLSLATYGPSYVSPNVVVGKEEALKFFPKDFKTPDEEKEEAAKTEVEEHKKVKKAAESSSTPHHKGPHHARATVEHPSPTHPTPPPAAAPAPAEKQAEGDKTVAPPQDVTAEVAEIAQTSPEGAEATEATPNEAPATEAQAGDAPDAQATTDAPVAAEEAAAAGEAAAATPDAESPASAPAEGAAAESAPATATE